MKTFQFFPLGFLHYNPKPSAYGYFILEKYPPTLFWTNWVRLVNKFHLTWVFQVSFRILSFFFEDAMESVETKFKRFDSFIIQFCEKTLCLASMALRATISTLYRKNDSWLHNKGKRVPKGRTPQSWWDVAAITVHKKEKVNNANAVMLH